MVVDSKWWTLKPGAPITFCEHITEEDCEETVNGVTYLRKRVDKVARTYCFWPGVRYIDDWIAHTGTLEESWEYRNQFWKDKSPEEFYVEISHPVANKKIELSHNMIQGDKIVFNETYWLEIGHSSK